MPDFIDRLGAELVRAASAEPRTRTAARAAWRPRFSRWTHLRPLVIALALAMLAAAGAVASGVLESGAPVVLKAPPVPTAGQGTAIPSTARLLPLRVADPAGGLPWGLRTARTTRGDVCLQVGRLAYGTTGGLGQDGAFGDDHRFHPFPENYLNESNCAAVDAHGHGFASFSFTGLPASALGLTDLGPAVSGCLSLLRPKCPAEDTRDVYFGLLGPDAVGITYVSGNGRKVSVPATGADGAYLIVTRSHPGEGPSHGPSGSSFTDGLILIPPNPIRTITYRDGHTCHASEVYPCPPIGLAPITRPQLTAAALASPIGVREVPGGSYCEQDRGPNVRPCGAAVPRGFTRVPSSPRSLLFEITFTARAASTTDDSFYYAALFFPARPSCHEIATGNATSSNIRAGQRLTFDELVLAGCHGIVQGVIRYHPRGAGGSAPEPDPTDPNSIQVGRFSIRIP